MKRSQLFPETNHNSLDSQQFPVLKEEKRNLSLFREEVVVRAKDGVYPAVRATIDSLLSVELSQLYGLLEKLGFSEEQFNSALQNMLRHTVIVIIFNKERTQIIATGSVALQKEFGAANQGLQLSRIGTVVPGYAYVAEEYRGRHLGKELLRLRFELIQDDFFRRWVAQTPAKKLRIKGQRLDAKPVRKKDLLLATKRENLLLYCDLRDADAHFGRVVEAAHAIGMDVTPRSQENMKPYDQVSVLHFQDHTLFYFFSGVPINTVGGREMRSRMNTIQAVYLYGPIKKRDALVKKVGQILLGSGATHNEAASYYSGMPHDVLVSVSEMLLGTSDYDKTLNVPRGSDELIQLQARLKRSKKLHLVTEPSYNTYRLSMGFPK